MACELFAGFNNSLETVTNFTRLIVRDSFNKVFKLLVDTELSVEETKLLTSLATIKNCIYSENSEIVNCMMDLVEYRNLAAEEVVEKVISGLYNINECDWGFVIYMLVLIDALAIEEHKCSGGECDGDEMAFNEMVCDKIFTIQCALLCSINMWVFLEGGWNTFATNMIVSTEKSNNFFNKVYWHVLRQ